MLNSEHFLSPDVWRGPIAATVAQAANGRDFSPLAACLGISSVTKEQIFRIIVYASFHSGPQGCAGEAYCSKSFAIGSVFACRKLRRAIRIAHESRPQPPDVLRFSCQLAQVQD
jgi:hypothetical protein